MRAEPGAAGTEVVLEEGTNFAPALSPDGSQIIIDLQGTLWSLPAEGGEAEALTDGLGDDRLKRLEIQVGPGRCGKAHAKGPRHMP